MLTRRWCLAAFALVAGCGLADESAPSTTSTAAASSSGSSGTAAVVERVIDGDSVELVIDGVIEESRLEGINAPELYTLADVDSCAGSAAKDQLASLLAAGSLTVEGAERDRFGRLLVELEVDGQPVRDALVASGWALALWSAEDEALTRAMVDAADGGQGWWGEECGVPQNTDVVISAVEADAPGDDRENLAEEWVELTNTGDDTVDLGEWTIRDETTSNRFVLDGVVLDPGASLRIRTGTGRSDRANRYLGEDFPVWSNRGETVLLVDPAGNIATHAFVGGNLG